jgi:hypothetical protein
MRRTSASPLKHLRGQDRDRLIIYNFLSSAVWSLLTFLSPIDQTINWMLFI